MKVPPSGGAELPVALITGSSRGIGLAVAHELAAAGYRIAINGRNPDRLHSAHAGLVNLAVDVLPVQADVTNDDEVKEMIGAVVNRFGRLDVLVNNAGLSMRANLSTLDADACRRMIDVDLLGVILPTRAALPALVKSRGSIIFTSSIAGLIGLPTATLYCAAKSGLRGFADALRIELAPEGVHVGVVYVGFTENEPDKTVLGDGGREISPGRQGHMSRQAVARAFVRLITRRRRQVILTPIGRSAAILTRVAPALVERAIVFARRTHLADRTGIR